MGVLVMVVMFNRLCVVMEGFMIWVWLFMFIRIGLIFRLFVCIFRILCMLLVVFVLVKIKVFVGLLSFEFGNICWCNFGFSVVLMFILLL